MKPKVAKEEAQAMALPEQAGAAASPPAGELPEQVLVLEVVRGGRVVRYVIRLSPEGAGNSAEISGWP